MNNQQNSEAARLNFWEKLFIPEIAKGLGSTFKEMVKYPKFTRQEPEITWQPTGSYRGRPVLVMDEDGERCVACELCSRVCPSLAIEVQAAETDKVKERFPEKFEINMLRCIFCGFCEEVCPEEAIVMSKEYNMVFTSQKDAIFGKDRLLFPAEELKDRLEFLRRNRQ